MNDKNIDLSDQFFNNVSIQILSQLFCSESALSIYEFDNRYSYRQYRYMLKKLERNLMIVSQKNGKRKSYKINYYYEELVKDLLEIKNVGMVTEYKFLPRSLSDDKMFLRLLSVLEKVEGWAFVSTTALLFWVPFLDLQLPRFTICVRDRYLKRRLEENLPSSLLEVQHLPSYFIRTDGVTLVSNLPVLKPELLFFQLLEHENSRVKLSSLFLLPFLSTNLLVQQLRNVPLFSSVMYSLLALEKFLKMETPLSSFFRQWFFNFDQFDREELLKQFLDYLGRNGLKKFEPTTLKRFELMRIKYLQETNQWDEWDRLAMLFPKRKLKFEPDDVMSIMKLPTVFV